MKYYSIQKPQITEVKGVFEYIGEDYEKIYVRSNTKLKAPFVEEELPQSLQEKLNAKIKEAKEAKIAELNNKCDALLVSFCSKALEEEHIYDGGLEDQINLMGALNLGIDMPFRCKKATSEHKENILHTKEQLAQVFNDGLKYKTDIINRCGALKSYVLSLNDIESIQEVSWESEIPS